MFKIQAQVHSLGAKAEVMILYEDGPNKVIAEYNGVKCTAIYNVFNGMYYVDDIYGVMSEEQYQRLLQQWKI